MGSYGIGVERILAAAVEKGEDEFGLRWNSALNPLDVIIIPLNSSEKEVIDLTDKVYADLQNSDLKVLVDDRDARPGVKMKDADLQGAPSQIIISPRNIDNGVVELKNRWTNERKFVKPEKAVPEVRAILASCLPSVL